MSLLRNIISRMERTGRSNPTHNPLPDHEEHGEGFLIKKVASVDRRPEVIRGGKGYIHGSSLIGMCPRRYALTILSGTKRHSPRPQDRIMWAIGRAVEHHIRDAFIRAMDRRGILGEWRCSCGKAKRVGEFSPTEKCTKCGQGLRTYKELALFDHTHRVVGNPDLPYIRPDNHKIRIVEIKSKKKELFDELELPEANHVLQASIYRRLSALNGMEVDDEVTIIYGSKDYSFSGNPYKEYHIPSCPAREETLDDMWSRAGEVRDFLAAHEEKGTSTVLPNRITACTSPTAPMAKACDECSACFARS